MSAAKHFDLLVVRPSFIPPIYSVLSRLSPMEDVSMEIRSLDHAALLVSDVERSRYFYGQVLGMEEVPRPSNFDFPGAWFRKGRAELHLIGANDPGRVAQVNPGYNAEEMSRGFGSHIAFEVDDLEKAQQHLHAHDVPLVGGPRPRGDGVMQMYVCDPDGYIVELFIHEK
jgi:catechol 2,3-dioxygenase-like lactoylglutathione lyase family enzyme